MSDYIGKWGLYRWFEEEGIDLVHPEDIDSFRALVPSGKVFHCIDDDGEYLILKYGNYTHRVKYELFRVIPEPQNGIGDIVKLRGTDIEGEIVDIGWHYKNMRHIFSLKIKGKKKSKRYWVEDFETGPRDAAV